MSNGILERLVADAELVADVGVRLGRIKDDGEFLSALSNARQALDDGGQSPPSPTVVSALQKALNITVKDISPITLNDLRSGWTPFEARAERRPGTFVFGFFCLLLLLATAYATQVYDRAASLYVTTLEMQDARAAEQAIRLLGFLKKNQKDVVESLASGNKDFLYEAFNKALFDLQLMNVKFQAYAPIAANVLSDLDMVGRLRDWLLYPFRGFTSAQNMEVSNPSGNAVIGSWIKNYDQQPAPDGGVAPLFLAAADSHKADINALLRSHISEIRSFTSTINVGFDPLVPNDYSYYTSRLREGMSFLGSWILPALYGMLGAVIFHMRRLLDPSVPNPSWLRFAYRIVLGGFAGIILVWFWTPTSLKQSQPAFATLTSFGLAFLVGFSTDVFFQALDRLVSYLSQAVGQPAP